jgi:hypothetical protein
MSNRYTTPIKSCTQRSPRPPVAPEKSAPNGSGPRPHSWGAARIQRGRINLVEPAPHAPLAAAACPPRADGLRHSRRALKDKCPTRARSRGGLRRRLAQPVPGNAPAQACRSAVLCARGQRRTQPGENQHPAPPRISPRAQRPAAPKPRRSAAVPTQRGGDRTPRPKTGGRCALFGRAHRLRCIEAERAAPNRAAGRSAPGNRDRQHVTRRQVTYDLHQRVLPKCSPSQAANVRV